MLTKADIPISTVIASLSSFRLEAGFLVPTPTGLEKSILDAHEDIRSFLAKSGLHCFDEQGQGPENKVKIPANIITEDGVIGTHASLYRPNTKSGDPRIWISKLNSYSKPWNLITLFVSNGQLFVFNASDRAVWNSISDTTSPLHLALVAAGSDYSAVETELLRKLKAIEAAGFVRSTTNAANGVGDTLEKLLGISRNSSKNPDYKGIEIKASRRNTPNQTQRSVLFSMVPNWDISELKNGAQILESYGYLSPKTNQVELYVTVKHQPNRQGLFLDLDAKNGLIVNKHQINELGKPVVSWKLNELQEELSKKHKQTFWVKAKNRPESGHEYFHYFEVMATAAPLVSYFGPLVLSNQISMDYTLSTKLRPSGAPFARDHGYLWKIANSSFDSLFPPPRMIDLATLSI
jgi:hypothetical protein